MARWLDLRTDLKRLSDEELAERFEATLGEREQIQPRRKPDIGFRGPVRHPRAYQVICAMQGGGTSSLLDLLLPFVILASRRAAKWATGSPQGRAYILNCELLDLRDEIERRVAARQGSPA